MSVALPKKMNLKLVEPLKHLFKDEVRLLGKNWDGGMMWSGDSLFPARGWLFALSAEVTAQRLSILRRSDTILCRKSAPMNLLLSYGNPLPSCSL